MAAITMATTATPRLTNRSKALPTDQGANSNNGRHCERIVALLLPSCSLHFEGVQMQLCGERRTSCASARPLRPGGSYRGPTCRRCLYVGVTVPFDVLDARHLIAQVDARLAHRLHYVTELGPPGAAAYDHLPVDDDVDTAPVVFWRAKDRGNAVALEGASISFLRCLVALRATYQCRRRQWGLPSHSGTGAGRLAGGRREPGRG